MPCTYEETPEERRQRQEANERKITQPYIDKLNEVTNLLCGVMGVIESAKDNCADGDEFYSTLTEEISLDAREWFEKHKEDDRRRLDELKASAFSKLTPEERKAIGF